MTDLGLCFAGRCLWSVCFIGKQNRIAACVILRKKLIFAHYLKLYAYLCNITSNRQSSKY